VVVDKKSSNFTKTDSNHPIIRGFSTLLEKGHVIDEIIPIALKAPSSSVLAAMIIPSTISGKIIIIPGIRDHFIDFLNQKNQNVRHFINHITIESDDTYHFTFLGIDKKAGKYDKLPRCFALPFPEVQNFKFCFSLSVSNISDFIPLENIECTVKVPKNDYERRSQLFKHIDGSRGELIDLSLGNFNLKREFVLYFYITTSQNEELDIELRFDETKNRQFMDIIKRVYPDGKIPFISKTFWFPQLGKGIHIKCMEIGLNSKPNPRIGEQKEPNLKYDIITKK
jgi:hypothetical protein